MSLLSVPHSIAFKPQPWNVDRAYVGDEYQDLWDGLRMAYLFDKGAGNPIDVINGPGAFRVGTPSWEVSSRGPGLLCDAASDGVEVPFPPHLQGVGWPITLAWYGFYPGTPDGLTMGILFNDVPGSPFTVAELSIQASGEIRMTGNNGGAFNNSATESGVQASTFTEPTLLTAVFESSDSWKLWVEKDMVMDFSPPSTGDPSWGANPLLAFSNDSERSTDTNAFHLGGAVWYRALGQAQVNSLVDDFFAQYRLDYSKFWGRAPAVGPNLVFTFPAPVLDGAAVTVGDGVVRIRHFNIPLGEYATPFWFVPDSDSSRAQRVNTLPAIVTLHAGTISISSTEP